MSKAAPCSPENHAVDRAVADLAGLLGILSDTTLTHSGVRSRASLLLRRTSSLLTIDNTEKKRKKRCLLMSNHGQEEEYANGRGIRTTSNDRVKPGWSITFNKKFIS